MFLLSYIQFGIISVNIHTYYNRHIIRKHLIIIVWAIFQCVVLLKTLKYCEVKTSYVFCVTNIQENCVTSTISYSHIQTSCSPCMCNVHNVKAFIKILFLRSLPTSPFLVIVKTVKAVLKSRFLVVIGSSY